MDTKVIWTLRNCLISTLLSGSKVNIVHTQGDVWTSSILPTLKQQDRSINTRLQSVQKAISLSLVTLVCATIINCGCPSIFQFQSQLMLFTKYKVFQHFGQQTCRKNLPPSWAMEQHKIINIRLLISCSTIRISTSPSSLCFEDAVCTCLCLHVLLPYWIKIHLSFA